MLLSRLFIRSVGLYTFHCMYNCMYIYACIDFKKKKFLRNPSTINPPQAKYLKRLINILNSFSLATKVFSFCFNENVRSLSTHQLNGNGVTEMQPCASVRLSIWMYLRETHNRIDNDNDDDDDGGGGGGMWQCVHGLLAYDAAYSGGCMIRARLWRQRQRQRRWMMREGNTRLFQRCECCRMHTNT